MGNTRLLTATISAALATGCGSEKKSEPTSSAAAEPKPAVTPTEPTPAEATPTEATPAEATPTEATPAEPTPTEATPAEPTPAKIDALLKIAAADGFRDMDLQSDLWTALFQLKQWHLMTFPDSKTLPPGLNIETHDGKKWVMAFTDTDRLHEYARARKQLNADGTMLGMSVPSQTSFEFFESLQGIEGVRFNEGDVGWFAPMGNLRAIHTHLKKLNRL